MHDHHVLLAEYTLGLLDGQETAEAHALLGQDTEAVKTALNWENNLLELVDLLPPVHPSWQVLQRIQSDLGHQPAPAPSSLYRKPASNGTSAAALHDGRAADASEAAQRPTKPASSASAGLSGEPIQPRTVTHTEPYFSAPPERPSTADVSNEATPQTATTIPASRGASTTPAPATDTAQSSPASAPSFASSPTVDGPSSSPSATSVTAGARPSPSSPAAEAADSTAHVMGERDARRVERVASEKPRKEKQKTAAVHEEAHKGGRAVSGNIWVWRSATLVFGLIALALALIPSEPVKPPVTVVQVAPTQAAILQAPGQSSTPGWIVTIDAQRNVLLNPQVRTDIPSDAAVQLWTRSKTMPQPRSLGLIDPNQPVTVPAALMGDMSPDQLFEMTQEPAGGSPTASPSGPVLFIGRLVTFGKPVPAPPQNNAAGTEPAASAR